MLASVRAVLPRASFRIRVPFHLNYATLGNFTSAEEEEPARPLSRWRRLKRERRAAPTPANRSKYPYDRSAEYDLSTALSHVRASQWAKFDESLELILRLNIDPRHADHNLRGVIQLPHGTGRHDKVAVIAEDEQAKRALAAGADLAGAHELIDRIANEKGKTLKGFAACIAEPHMFEKVAAKLGRILGPKGLLPSQKTKTVTDDIENAVKEVKKGRLCYRTDKEGNMHLHVGKMSFPDEALVENTIQSVKHILSVRPASLKGKYLLKATICSSMGPSVKIDRQTLMRQIAETR
ncbi:Ribosomal protein L1 [Gracilaria domingensis]|nr:Ribosomal protein L1 [Gracilaria domingensis]